MTDQTEEESHKTRARQMKMSPIFKRSRHENWILSLINKLRTEESTPLNVLFDNENPFHGAIAKLRPNDIHQWMYFASAIIRRALLGLGGKDARPRLDVSRLKGALKVHLGGQFDSFETMLNLAIEHKSAMFPSKKSAYPKPPSSDIQASLKRVTGHSQCTKKVAYAIGIFYLFCAARVQRLVDRFAEVNPKLAVAGFLVKRGLNAVMIKAPNDFLTAVWRSDIPFTRKVTVKSKGTGWPLRSSRIRASMRGKGSAVKVGKNVTEGVQFIARGIHNTMMQHLRHSKSPMKRSAPDVAMAARQLMGDEAFSRMFVYVPAEVAPPRDS